MSLLGRGLSLSALRRSSVSRTTVYIRTSTSSATGEGYVKRNRRMGRPLSPSLAIMTKHPDMVWVLSLSHRTSGIILTAGVSAGSIAYLVSGKSFPEFITSFQSVAHYPILWTATKFIVALPLCYHMVNGIRHLAWDAGKGFEMKTLYKTGYIMLATTLLLTGALTFYKPSP